ncbi:MAG: hypothetical protein JJE22_10845, partial [Bacteroidia bacterium]|nr:hypothetical protein [Bacteroidia bacterium]
MIFNKEIDFKSVELDNITAKIKRQLPDTAFNFQFIIDAFAPASSSPTNPADSTSSAIAVRSVKLNNSRIVYKDVVTGNDVVAWVDHLDTRFDTFDPEHLNFDIPETNMNGVVASIYQVKPLATSDPEIKDILEAKQPPEFSLNFKRANFTNFKLDYRNDVSATYARFDLGDIKVTSNKLDLNNRIIDLENVSLNNTNSTIRFGKNEEAKVVVKEAKQEAQSQAEAGWRIRVASINLNNNNLQFDDDNSPRLKSGMDYSHLATEGLTLQMNDFLFTSDSITGKINKGSFKEHSGFVLNELKTDFLYSNNEAYLKDLYIKTPGTELQRSAVLHYASIEAMQQDIGNMNIELDLQDSRLLVKDILTFVPALRQQPAFADPNTTWFLNSRISGKISDLHITSLQVSGLKDTRIDASGTITGLPDMKKLYANLSIKNITSSRRDISLFIPKNTLPTNVTLPGYLSLKGTINGNQTGMNADLALATDMGDATIKGVFSELTDMQHAGYDATVNTRSLQIGTIIQNPEVVGPLSATFTVKGTGLDSKTAKAEFNGIVHSAVIKNYNYTNATINGNIANQKISMDAGMTDPNIHFALNAVADVSTEYPAIRISGRVDSVKLEQLHLTDEAMIFRGMINADFPVTDPDKLEGKLFLTQSLLVLNDQRLQLDTVQLLAGSNDTGRFIRLNSNIMNAQLTGQYKLTELRNIFQQAIQPYFAVVPGKNVVTHEPYNFSLNAYILDNPALKIFIPGLQRMDSIKLESHFSDKNGWTAKLNAPAIDMGLNKIRNLNLQAGTNQNALDVTATLQKFSSGSSIIVDNTTLTARVADNKIDFTVNIKDQRSKEKYNISGLFEQPVNGKYQFSIKPDSLLLNYDAWNVSANNKISITKQGLNANQLVLS